MKTRIVEITLRNGKTVYQIQQKHFLFRWMWVGVGCNSWDIYIQDTYPTFEEADKNLCWHDGTKNKIKVIKCV